MFWPLKVLRGAIAVNELLRYQGHPAVLVHPAIMHVLLDTYTAGTANTVNLCSITIFVQVLTQAGRQIISRPARQCYYRRLTNNCTGLTTRYSKTISVFLTFIFLYFDCTMHAIITRVVFAVVNVSKKLTFIMNTIYTVHLLELTQLSRLNHILHTTKK